MSKSVNVDFVTRQIEVDTDGKEHFISAAMAAKDAEQSMLNAQNAAKEVKEIYGDGNFTPLLDLLGGLGTKLKRWGAIFANKVFASNLPIVYNSVAEMKVDTMLWEGMNTKTLGYYTSNDGGSASYLIRAKADSDTVDNGSLHELANGLVAELLIENSTVCPEQFGAKGDGVTDDTQALQLCINYTVENDIVAILSKYYYITSDIRVHRGNVRIKGNGTIHRYSADAPILHDIQCLRLMRNKTISIEGITFIVDGNSNTYGGTTTIHTMHIHHSCKPALGDSSWDGDVDSYQKLEYARIENCAFIDKIGEINSLEYVYQGVICLSGYGLTELMNDKSENIYILNNTFTDVVGRIIYCTSCRNILISGNKFYNVCKHVFDAATTQIVFREISCENVIIKDNFINLSKECLYATSKMTAQIFRLDVNDANDGIPKNFTITNNYIATGNGRTDVFLLRNIQNLKADNNKIKIEETISGSNSFAITYMKDQTVENCIFENNLIEIPSSDKSFYNIDSSSVTPITIKNDRYFATNGDNVTRLIGSGVVNLNIDNCLGMVDGQYLLINKTNSPASVENQIFTVGRGASLVSDGVLTTRTYFDTVWCTNSSDINITSIVASDGDIKNGYKLTIIASSVNVTVNLGTTVSATVSAKQPITVKYSETVGGWIRIA